jgi:hypothetical protein
VRQSGSEAINVDKEVVVAVGSGKTRGPGGAGTAPNVQPLQLFNVQITIDNERMNES